MHYRTATHSIILWAQVAFFGLSGLLLAALGVTLAFPQPAYAYVDPSVMTYTIQALAGVAVALSAVAGVALRRSRKALVNIFGVDENSRKTYDPDIDRLEWDAANIYAASPEVPDEGKEASREEEKIPWGKRFVFALFVVGFCGFTLGIAAPSEIVAGARSDLFYRLTDVLMPLIVFTSVATVVLSLILSVLPKRVYTPFLVLAFSVGLACYVQSLALNYGLPPADGGNVEWVEEFMPQMIISGIVWLAILLIPMILQRRNRPLARLTVCCLSVALVIVQGVGVVSLIAQEVQMANPEGRTIVTDDGIYTLNRDNNVVVFVLDCYDTKVFREALEGDPSIVDEMEGFTWYPNHAGVMIPTSFAVPYLLTGVAPTEGQDIVGDYVVSRYTDSSFLEDLDKANYSIGLYSDTFGLSYLDYTQEREQIADHTINFHRLDIDGFTMSYPDVIVMLSRCALYRDMPWVLKWRFWFYTDELNWRLVRPPDDFSVATNYYVIDDTRFFTRLDMVGLSLEEGDFDGAMRFIHMLGAHYPYSLDENGNDIGVGNSDQLRQARGSMRKVGTYLRKMKELGVYDDATIIITSDHGDWSASMELPTESTEPILLVKRAGDTGSTWENLHASGEDARFAYGLLVSEAPVSHAEFQGTVLAAMGLHDDAFPTTYDTQFEEDRERTFFHILHGKTARIYGLLKYTIRGDVEDFANWVYTGEVWEMDYNNNLH